MGGTARPDTNGQANLILLCLGCHSRVEAEREWARQHGLLIRQYQTPCEVPLMWHSCRVRLHDDGTVHLLAAEEPTYAELRARLLLAQSLINHRRTADGLSARDAEQVLAALNGRWDAT
jgi:hypothetical protein